MAPKPKASPGKKRRASPVPADPEGIFAGMVVFLVPAGVQPRRLQIWKQRLVQMGAVVSDVLSKKVTHIFAAKSTSVHQVPVEFVKHFKGKLLNCQWLEDCLTFGEHVDEDPYILSLYGDQLNGSCESFNKVILQNPETTHSDSASVHCNVAKTFSGNLRAVKGIENNQMLGSPDEQTKIQAHDIIQNDTDSRRKRHDSSISDDANDSDTSDGEDNASQLSSSYNPPDLNRNITEIFGKLVNIYRALGEDRRSFSYHKAIPVIEKLPFKIETVDQVKNLPSIGKSMQDHVNEIVTTGKLSKLEHFEADHKVRTIALFGDVWGIGPATALKLYEKGHRTLDDLRNDNSLNNVQRIGLEFFDDIQKRIPRNEVEYMEKLIQEVGKDILPGAMIVCGGSYRRGKASCGDLDIIITHPDGESHQGFLPRLVQRLKDINFLREDLVFSIHSTEVSDSGVDTYFGLCSYPGRDQRHRIDLKVYPRSIYAFGLIAWTGNDVLNRRLRILADSKGYRLDDTGLFLATPNSGTKRGFRSSASVSCNTEREVFDVLGFPWLEPSERNL